MSVELHASLVHGLLQEEVGPWVLAVDTDFRVCYENSYTKITYKFIDRSLDDSLLQRLAVRSAQHYEQLLSHRAFRASLA